MYDALRKQDPEIAALVDGEQERQRTVIRLIASENYASRAVQEASSTPLSNKYSEGYPGKRYYEGQQYIDQVEQLAIDRLKALFGAEHANVQPYSGSPANMAVYFGLIEPGAPVMGLGLPHGGHLTHGWGVNFSGKLYQSHQYPVDKVTERIDYDEVRRIAHEVKPKLIFAGTTAYPRFVDWAFFREVADEVGAYLACDIAHISGLVADASNQPLAGAQVALVAASDGGPMGRGGIGTSGTTTDQSGSFRFDHLAAGRYTVTASLRNASSSQQQVVLAAGQSQDAVIISLPAGATVQGTLTGLAADKRGNVLVSASGADEPLPPVRAPAAPGPAARPATSPCSRCALSASEPSFSWNTTAPRRSAMVSRPSATSRS